MGKKKSNRGRPSLYEDKVLPRLEEIGLWVRAGATQAEIASALGIAASTFSSYCDQYKELRDIVKTEKMTGVPEIKLKLYNRAKGYDYEERKTYIKRDEETGKETSYTEVTTKHMPSDVSACLAYLRNCAEDWSDRDKLTVEMKKREMELREKIADMQSF